MGVELSSSQVTAVYGPRFVALLSEMMVVDKVVYPYQEGDTVDALLNITLDGSWRGSGPGAGFAIGLTLGLLSPFIGPSIVGNHDLRATLEENGNNIASHSAHIESKITWGIAADANAVGARADDLQTRKIAVSIGEWLQANRTLILKDQK
jgi:hypothetical protein